MERKGLFLYFDDAKQFDLLDDAQLGELIRGLVAHAENGAIPAFTDSAVKMAYSFLSARSDRDASKYDEICRKRQENGKRGGRPSKANASAKNQMVNSESKKSLPNPNPNPKPNPNPHIERDSTDKPRRFIPPSFEEVKAYISERGCTVDAKQFLDYYAAHQWHDRDGKPVKNWKQKLISWENRRGGKKPADHGYQEHHFEESELNKLIVDLDNPA